MAANLSRYLLDPESLLETATKYAALKKAVLKKFDDDTPVEKVLVRKYRAFRTLLSKYPESLTESFCSEYHESLQLILPSSVYQKIKEFLAESELDGQLDFLKSFTLCIAKGHVCIDIFHKYPPPEWRKEFLICTLMFPFASRIDGVRRVTKKINAIEMPHLTESVIETILFNEQNIQYDLELINDVFFVLDRLSCDMELLKRHVFNLAAMKDHIKQIKVKMFTEHISGFRSIEYDTELIYFLKYPIEVLRIVLSKRKNINLNQLNELKKLLEIWDSEDGDRTDQINTLLNLDAEAPFKQWKYEITFHLVKHIINCIFSKYEEFYWTLKINDKALECIYKLSTSTISCTCYDINNICKFHKTNAVCDLLYCLNGTLARVILNCCSSLPYAFNFIKDMIARMTNAKIITQITNAFDTVDEYNKQLSLKDLVSYFSDLSVENYESKIHKYVVEHTFSVPSEKTVDQLLDEVSVINPEAKEMITAKLTLVKEHYETESKCFPTNGVVKSWSKAHIETWCKYVKEFNECHKITVEEILAVLIRAVEVTHKLKLRDVQLISVLAMIEITEGVGRLAQVNTGEGKTVIIAVLAAYFAQRGRKVDVYTSSPVLAIPQSTEFKCFYDICQVSVTHNIPYNSSYRHDVIYGTNSSFQRDLLLDEFRKNGVRKNRGFDVAIIDEVDNMLIDGNNWLLQLSRDMPGMDYLEVVLAAIYIQVQETARCLTEGDGTVYYILREHSIDEHGNVSKEAIEEFVPIDCSKKEFVIKCTETHIRKLIRDKNYSEIIEDDYPVIKIPEHLRELVCESHLKKWIENAVDAIFLYVKDEDYIIKDGKIVIVDADNTGVIKQNSSWSNGLHQYLEIKHGAKVSPESFTTNFISNVGIFTRYKSISGLTGTLGSDDTRMFLQKTYNVDSVVIPPFKFKQHQHLNAIIVSDMIEQYKAIAKSCIRKVRNGRAVLIIMKYIKETDKLAEVFTKDFHYDSSKIKLFKTDDDVHVVSKALRPGCIVITTNIAGRGTDIKLNRDVEDNGGLHVCLTFLPVNSRVEQQNFGRTSRKGNWGTSQLVLYDKNNTTIEELKASRAVRESNIMAKASETVKVIKKKDKIFHQFCNLLNKIKGRNSDTIDIERNAIEERFAIWLMINKNILDKDNNEVFEKFDNFKETILEDDRRNELIKNPSMYIQLGNIYLDRKQFEQSILEFTKAIDLDHNFAEHAYYNRAWACIGKYGHNVDQYEYYINEAVNDLKKSRKLIYEKEHALHLLQTASKSEVFSKQVTNKLNLYNIQKNTIELAIGPDMQVLDERLRELNDLIKKGSLKEDEIAKVKESITHLKESKKDIGIIGRAKLNKRNIQIEPLGDEAISKSEIKDYEDEITEFAKNGWIGGFKISETKPIDWASVISLLGIGLGQLIIGAALVVFTLGAGASIGIGLMMEGVSDMITAVKDGIINRSFDWATWALMKVISVAVSIVCAGFKAIKDVARTAYTGVKNVATKAMTQVTKQGWKLVAKKIGHDLAKGVAKEIVTDLVIYGLDKTCMAFIEAKIYELLKTPIQNAIMENKEIMTMLKIDGKNHNCFYETQIRSIAQNLLTTGSSPFKSAAHHLASRVAAEQGAGITLQTCLRLVNASDLIYVTATFLNNFKSAVKNITVNESVDESDENEYTIESRNQPSDNYEQGSNKNISNDDINLNKLTQSEEQVRSKNRVHTTDNLSDVISNMASANILSVLKGVVVAPLVQMGTNYTVDKISAKVNSSLEKDIGVYRSKTNVIYQQNMGYKSDPNKKGINKTNLDHCSEHDLNKVDKIIDDLRNGGPASLVHLGAVSDAIDRPIEVRDAKGRPYFSIGDTKATKPIVIQYHPSDDGGIGHYTLMGHVEPSVRSGADNMCLFNVISEQTGYKPNDLKRRTLDIMESNKSTLTKQMRDVSRIEMYDEASLVKGGAQYDGKCMEDAMKYLNKSNGTIGFANVVPGHSDIHVQGKRETMDILKAVADGTGHQVFVYDDKGNVVHVIGEKSDKEPIKLQQDVPIGHLLAENFTSLNDNIKYSVHDENFYKLIGKHTGVKADELKTAAGAGIPAGSCVENKTRTEQCKKTGFFNTEDQTLVFQHAMISPKAKDEMDELNKYPTHANLKKKRPEMKYTKRAVRVEASDMNLPRKVYAGKWVNGQLVATWEVKDVTVVIQHHQGKENDKHAPVHIQTFYPNEK